MIRTRNPKQRAAADPLFRSRSTWDRSFHLAYKSSLGSYFTCDFYFAELCRFYVALDVEGVDATGHRAVPSTPLSYRGYTRLESPHGNWIYWLKVLSTYIHVLPHFLKIVFDLFFPETYNPHIICTRHYNPRISSCAMPLFKKADRNYTTVAKVGLILK